MSPMLRTTAALAALLFTLPASAAPVGLSGAYAGALAGYGSMVFSGGPRAGEAEVIRTDAYGNEATARSVLRDGALHASANSHYNQPPSCRHTPSTCLPSKASAYVEFWDIVTFTRSELADPSQIRWRFDIHGIELNGPLHGGTASASFSYQVSDRMRWAPPPFFSVQDGDVLRGSIEMVEDELTIWVYAGLSVNAMNGGWADYGNTARFHLDLPPGVTFTSASGHFLADRPPVAAVAEPPALALGLMGLLAAACRLGQRRGRRQPAAKRRPVSR